LQCVNYRNCIIRKRPATVCPLKYTLIRWVSTCFGTKETVISDACIPVLTVLGTSSPRHVTVTSRLPLPAPIALTITTTHSHCTLYNYHNWSVTISTHTCGTKQLMSNSLCVAVCYRVRCMVLRCWTIADCVAQHYLHMCWFVHLFSFPMTHSMVFRLLPVLLRFSVFFLPLFF